MAAIEERGHEPPDGETLRSPFTLQALEQKSGPYTPEPTARGEAEARAFPARDAEHKPVTALCCRLAWPVVPTVALDPEARHRQLQALVATAQTVNLRYGGTITQLAEDGLLALFGALVAQEDHARRAVLAALDLRQTWQDSQGIAGPPLQACIGVHTGLVVVGNLGDAVSRAGFGMLFARFGRRERARAELSAAIELYRAMDMTFWPDQAEAALTSLPQTDTAHKILL